MVIGFDGSRAFQENRTGTENYSYQLLKALAKIDQNNTYTIYIRPHSVILSSSPVILNDSEGSQDLKSTRPSFRGRDSSQARNDSREWPRNFQFREIAWPRLWTQGGLAIQTFRDHLDVLFVPAHTLPLIRKPGLKTVVTVHDLGSEYLPSMHQIRQRLYLGFMQKYQLKSATRIIAVSKATKQDLIQRAGIKPAKISVVYEGYDKGLFKPVKNDLLVNSLRQYGLQPNNYFLFVGTVQPRKNLERLIKAFAVHLEGEEMRLHLRGGLKLVIVGQRGWMSDQIYALPKKLGIEGRVKFLGYVPEKDLPALYSGAIALTFPSLFEGFGLPILEAQACGCPVLTSNISSMPEVAGSGVIFVDPYPIDDIVEGMKKIENGKLRMEKAKQGFINVKRFSWEKCARETLEVLSSSFGHYVPSG